MHDHLHTCRYICMYNHARHRAYGEVKGQSQVLDLAFYFVSGSQMDKLKIK